MSRARPTPLDARGRRPLLALTLLLTTLAALLPARAALADALPELIARTKPSVVGVGSVSREPKPHTQFAGSGFVAGDGNQVVTNAHVVDAVEKRGGGVVVLVPRGRTVEARPARVVGRDARRDLALLRVEGPPLPALRLGDSERVREGEAIAVTGYPIGGVLGLNASTHLGIVSSITPVSIPAESARELTPERIEALREPFEVFQLDLTAYPGHSGSPVLLTATGEVVAVLNSIVVKNVKENALSEPSAIAYAIPTRHVRSLLDADPGADRRAQTARSPGDLVR